MAYSRNVRNSGMNRGQFIRTAGMGAAAIGAASMGMSSFASAQAVGGSEAIYCSLGRIPTGTDDASFMKFIEIVRDGAQLDLSFVSNAPVTQTGKPVTIADVSSGYVNWGSGLSMQADGTSLWTHLYWHQPMMDMTLQEFIGWLYFGGGLQLRQQYLSEKYNVVALPYRVNPGEGGGWSVMPLDNLIANPSMWRMRVSGPLLVGVLGQAYPGIYLPATTAGAGDDARRLTLPLDDPSYLNSLEFHIATADDGVCKWTDNLGTHHITEIVDSQGYPTMHYYIDCWWSQASIFELWINKSHWDALGSSKQAVIKAAAMASVYDNLVNTLPLQSGVIEKWQSVGVTVHQSWPDTVFKQLEQAKKAKFREWTRDPKFNAVLSSMERFVGRKL